MEQDVRQMEAVGIGVPEKIIQDEGGVLDRSIMPGEGVEKKMVAEGLEDQDRTFDERIIARQILIIPHQLPLEGGHSYNEADKREKKAPSPIALENMSDRGPECRPCSGTSGNIVRHRQKGLRFEKPLNTRAPFRYRKDALHVLTIE